MAMSAKRIHISLPEALLARVDAIAADSYIDRSAAVCCVLAAGLRSLGDGDDALEGEPAAPPQPPPDDDGMVIEPGTDPAVVERLRRMRREAATPTR